MESMTRRAFGQRLVLLGAVMAMPFQLAGCLFATVWADIQKYVPVGLQAFAAVVSILTGQGIITGAAAAIQALITAVTAAFGTVSSAVTSYEASANNTTLGAVANALTAAANSIQQFWANLNIPDANLAATIKGLLEVITTTLSGFIAALPSSSVALQAPSPNSLSMTPHRRSLHAFKSDFNKVLKAGNFEAHKLK